MRPLTPEAARAILARESCIIVDLAYEGPFETFDRLGLVMVSESPE